MAVATFNCQFYCSIYSLGVGISGSVPSVGSVGSGNADGGGGGGGGAAVQYVATR